MCGITGYISHKVKSHSNIVHAMAAQINHRGPDALGVWHDAQAGIALAHQRLSIIDLSDAGRQPMISPNGQFVLVFNGEIYNHQELRNKLKTENSQNSWSGYSDTETLLIALQNWGLAKTLPKLNGMFAFACWDRKNQTLSLARDRIGEKPLYYGTCKGSFIFGSELKALVAHPDWRGEIDRNALTLYMRHNYIPSPYSIYKGIAKLPPAHYVEISAANITVSKPICYWVFKDITQVKRRSDNPKLLIDELDERLSKTVAMRMESDMPLGAFLSGGIDSSTIVSLMQAQSSIPIRTFTIGFDVAGYNEAENAKSIAAHLGTNHTELYLTANDVLNTVPHLPKIWDEPFADSSQIPTFLLNKMASDHVSVALSGDGGDELFCGYNRYAQGYTLYQRLQHLPRPILRILSRIMRIIPTHHIDYIINCLPLFLRYPTIGDRLHKLANVLYNSDINTFYRTLVSHFQNPEVYVLGGTEYSTILNQPREWPIFEDFRECMMFLDTLTYLSDDILTKVDRASMAVSLEARTPFLDHELIEFAWSLPLDVKLHNGHSKWILRQVLNRYVPQALTNRPKMGFGIPIEHWLSGPLRSWAEELLDERSLHHEEIFDVSLIRNLWNEYCNGKKHLYSQLWSILMFQAWLRK